MSFCMNMSYKTSSTLFKIMLAFDSNSSTYAFDSAYVINFKRSPHVLRFECTYKLSLCDNYDDLFKEENNFK